MLEYRAEGLCRNASHLRREELDHCIAAGEVLQSTALAFDTNRRLRFELCGHHAYMPFEECLDTAPGETVKEIAVLTRVGRPTCFVVQGTTQDESGEAVYLLSRAAAQRACREQYLDQLENGSVIPCTVTHIENFGAFCDVGCGISALLPIDCLSVSRIASPADRVTVGQQLLCAIKNRDEQDRIVLTLRELLGTWSENAACFAAGELDFLTLEVRPSNAAALALYRELGFQPVGRRRDFYTDPTEDALLLTKTFKKEEPDG